MNDSASRWLLLNAQLFEADGLSDIVVSPDGLAIVDAGSAIDTTTEPSHVFDCQGRLVLPGLVEPHIHLDKALLLEEFGFNPDGTLRTALELNREAKKCYTPESVQARAERAARLYIANGVTAIRCHVDIDGDVELTALMGVLQARDALRDQVSIQLVAFPHRGTIKDPAGRHLLEEAVKAGAEVLGAFPDTELTVDDGHRHLTDMVELAAREGIPLDVHLDESDDPESRFLESLVELTVRNGMQGRVVASHACAFGSYPPEYRRWLIGQLAEAGVAVIACPQTNLIMGGRTDDRAPRRGLAPVQELVTGGVTTAYGQDNMQDMFCPFGVGDTLQNGHVLALAAHMSAESDMRTIVSMTSDRAAAAIGLADYGIRDGGVGDLVLLDARTAYEAILRRPDRLLVFKNGRATAGTALPAAFQGTAADGDPR